MALLIDTSVLIELERRDLDLAALSNLVPEEPVAIATITASELLAGVHRADRRERRIRREAFVESLLQFLPVLPFDLRLARAHARIWSELSARGERIGAHDLLIAATALGHGLGILTENERDFGRIPELPVSRPAW